MNYRIIRFVGGLTAVITHVLACFEAAANMQCGEAGKLYTSNGNRYYCTYRAVSGRCLVQGGDTSKLLDMVKTVESHNSLWVYYTSGQTSGVFSWCNGGDLLVIRSGERPGWEAGLIPVAAGKVTICCSQTSGIFGTGSGDYSSSDVSVATGATWHVPIISFSGCALGRRVATESTLTTAQKAVCVNGVSGVAATAYAGTVDTCCKPCPCGKVDASGNVTYDSSITYGINDPYSGISCPTGAAYEFVTGSQDCMIDGGASTGSDAAGTYMTSNQCYYAL